MNSDYVFERRVDCSTTAPRPTRIDLYKRDCFVMEAKQSAKRAKAKQEDPWQPDLIPEDRGRLGPVWRHAPDPKMGRAIRAARQAEDYARAL